VIGFTVITVLLVLGLAQSWLVRSGRSLVPWLDYSKLSKHFRRTEKSGGKPGRFARKTAPRDAGAAQAPMPPPATAPWTAPQTQQSPWQGPPQGQPWQPPSHQAPYQPPSYQPAAPHQQPYQPPPGQPYQPGYQPPPASPQPPGGPPANHPPARDAGTKRKWTKRP